MKKLFSLMALGLALSCTGVFAASHAGAPMKAGDSACEKSAADKKLAGAAKASHIKKCEKDAAAAGGGDAAAMCDKSAADKKLAGAAKASHVKKCMADAKPAAEAKPMAAAKPAADAKPAAAAAAKPATDAKK